MLKVSVSERAIRSMLRKVIEGKDETSPVNTNPTVDPIAAQTQPDNGNFVPQNRAELRSALHQIVDAVPDGAAQDAYTAIKSAVEDVVSDEKMPAEDKPPVEKVESMNRTKMTLAEKVAENIIRRKIRSIIKEAGYESLGFSGYEFGSEDDDDNEKKPRRKIMSVADVSGDLLQQIASEFGRSISGAKRLYDVSENTAKFMGALLSKTDDSFKILTLTAMSEFVRAAAAQGKLDDEEAETWLNNPEIVADNKQYRVYLSEYIKQAMRQAVDQYLKMRPDEIEDYFNERFSDDPTYAAKMVQQVHKNPMWEVPRIPTFYEFVEDAFDLNIDAISPPKQPIDKLYASYEKAGKGRSGE